MRVYVLILFFLPALLSCGRKDAFTRHSSGLEYRFIESNTTGASPESGDIVVLSIRHETADGRVIDESPLYRTQVRVPAYAGDFNTGLQLVQVGDSVCFRLDAGDYYEKNRKRELPAGLQQGDPVLIFFRLKNIIGAGTLEQERRSMYHTDELQEQALLKDYLERTDIQVEPRESGLYVLILEEGSGVEARSGNTITVHYTGKGIDGRVFDTSLDKPQPLSFVLGRGEVIQGWDEGFAGMKAGTRARLIVPSRLAYGEKGFRDIILPYSTLIFDVELIAVN